MYPKSVVLPVGYLDVPTTPVEAKKPVASAPSPIPARNSDPDTSHDAADGLDTTALELVVYTCLRDYGRQTTEQIATRTGLSVVTVSPRMKPLEKLHKVRRAGRGTNRSGKTAILWEVV